MAVTLDKIENVNDSRVKCMIGERKGIHYLQNGNHLCLCSGKNGPIILNVDDCEVLKNDDELTSNDVNEIRKYSDDWHKQCAADGINTSYRYWRDYLRKRRSEDEKCKSSFPVNESNDRISTWLALIDLKEKDDKPDTSTSEWYSNRRHSL